MKVTNLALFEHSDVEERVDRSGIDARHRCCIFEAQIIWHLGAKVFRNDAV